MNIPASIVDVRLFIRLFLGLILLGGGISKIAHPARFRTGIQEYRLLPTRLEATLAFSMILAVGIASTEIVLGLALVSGIFLVLACMLTIILFTLFCGAVLINLLRGRHDLACHCAGGLSSQTISWWLLARNIGFMGSLLVLLLTPSDTFTLSLLVHRQFIVSTDVVVDTIIPVVLLTAGVLAVLALLDYGRVLWHS